MKTLLVKIIAACAGAGTAMAFAASTSAAQGGAGLLIWAFIGFCGMLIMVQAVPALVLFIAILKGLFSAPDKEVTFSKQ